MNIQNQDDGRRGTFYINENAETIGELIYRWESPTLFTIEHTEVAEKQEGKGVGKQLVQHAVEFARQKHSKIIPACPFANAVIKRTPEYQDVLNK